LLSDLGKQTHRNGQPASPKSKIEVLRENGIAPQTANRYERLAGGSDPEIREKVHTASDQYFERCLEEGKTPKVAELTEIVDGICGLVPQQRLTPIEKQKGAMVSVLRKICKTRVVAKRILNLTPMLLLMLSSRKIWQRLFNSIASGKRLLIVASSPTID
jgi:hypothetical protein